MTEVRKVVQEGSYKLGCLIKYNNQWFRVIRVTPGSEETEEVIAVPVEE